jgi:hypothetical protein
VSNGGIVVTVKQQLHVLVDDLDDESAAEVLDFALRAARRATDDGLSAPIATVSSTDVDRDSLWQVARPISHDDPFWSNPGLLDDDGPRDMSSNKHGYLAEIYADLHDE